MNSAGRHRGQRGFTLVELIVAFTILMVLSTLAVPLARYTVRRNKEIALRNALEEMRHAIDKYKDMSDQQKIVPGKLDSQGYPESLQQLVDGVKLAGSVDKKQKFLRRIPLDPMTNTRDWGLRSMQDDPDSMAWGGQNVFDVYTKSQEKARDGTPYSQW
ncbi:MAG TPA: type II secretion system protein [Bryobacteraceae bacterium]|nr:type II secretion system protein [Bryobacteraceae bacterium]